MSALQPDSLYEAPPPRRLLVVGTGRCGTGYMARLLRACGLSTGHEQVYGPAQAHGVPPLWGDLAAECSWLATPALPDVGADVAVVLLVRHPLAVIGSLCGLGVFDEGRAGDPYTGAYYRFAPAIAAQRTGPLRALAAWLLLNEHARVHAQMVAAVETLDAAVLTEVVGLTGRQFTLAQAREAIRRVGADPRAANASPGPARLSWAVFAGADRHQFDVQRLVYRARRLARDFGYDPDTVPGGE